MLQGLKISERRACRLVGPARTTLRSRVIELAETVELKARIIDLADARRRFGCRRIHDLPHREGVHTNHTKIYRLYRDSVLAVHRHKGVGRFCEVRFQHLTWGAA
jgi:putative transposase